MSRSSRKSPYGVLIVYRDSPDTIRPVAAKWIRTLAANATPVPMSTYSGPEPLDPEFPKKKKKRRRRGGSAY